MVCHTLRIVRHTLRSVCSASEVLQPAMLDGESGFASRPDQKSFELVSDAGMPSITPIGLFSSQSSI